MSGTHPHHLIAIPETLLPADHPDTAARERLSAGQEPAAVAAALPASSLAWAVLAEHSAQNGDWVTSYAFARTGYHRGLDALRRAGWRGQGPVPSTHQPNQGVLRAIAALAAAAQGINETEEAERCRTLLRDCDASWGAA